MSLPFHKLDVIGWLGAGACFSLASCCFRAPDVVRPPVTKSGGVYRTRIEAKARWNDTGITLEKGRTYHFHVEGTWTDWIVKCDANGAVSPFIRWLYRPLRPGLRLPPRKDPDAGFFMPIATLGRGSGDELPEHAIVIRDGMRWTVPESGILHTFANDWPRAYGNNHGSLLLEVREEPHAE
ncbi:hypothetical protein [Luteolibacter sp. LG18]|uniref:hypothetical protein n=1 Tax=Luteolibacter sp. LG18 TaxID=2819286 RepID=UPI002B2F3088|nr:hypothetical protein llg_31060 [Luteolibacter sp. LG18]